MKLRRNHQRVGKWAFGSRIVLIIMIVISMIIGINSYVNKTNNPIPSSDQIFENAIQNEIMESMVEIDSSEDQLTMYNYFSVIKKSKTNQEFINYKLYGDILSHKSRKSKITIDGNIQCFAPLSLFFNQTVAKIEIQKLDCKLSPKEIKFWHDWINLHRKIVEWSIKYGQLDVISGRSLGQEGCFIVVIADIPHKEGIAFEFKKNQTNSHWINSKITIDSLEKKMSNKFFPKLSPNLGKKIKGNINITHWDQ